MRSLFTHHPSRRARIEYALGDAAGRDRAAVAAHLLGCASCRAEVEAAAFIQREARSLAEAPAATAAPVEVLERVLAARAARVRAVVPRTMPRSPRQRTSWLLSLAAAAALILAISMRPEPRIAAPAIPEFSTGLFSPTLAFAQEGIPVQPTPLDPGRIASLRSATAQYRMQWFDADGEEAGSIRTVERLVVSPVAGASIVLVRTTPRPAGPLVDSLVLDRGSLAPLRQVLRRSRFRIVDSVAGGVLTRQFPERSREGRIVTRTTSRVLPHAVADHPVLLAPGLALPLYLRAAVIGRASRIAIVEIAGRSGGDSLAAGTNTVIARVVGEDRLTTPAGTFDAWRMELEHTPRDVQQLLWIAKGSQALVQTQRFVRGTLAMETVLERMTR